ncbi:hypothetical protein NXT3_PB00280 (plasmid) [Sinorhizobium fredii]|uniref:Uncharacterized protein n=1 Tax=Rhizobium fredii TaxID=380 RepID=A0A2L0HBR1_RHIFR|nr:hypothetical protein NXT3_PB00280 [Sinorhizobium fredii]
MPIRPSIVPKTLAKTCLTGIVRRSAYTCKMNGVDPLDRHVVRVQDYLLALPHFGRSAGVVPRHERVDF